MYQNRNKGFRPNRDRNTDNKYKGLTVEVRNGDFTKALRIFKKKVQDDGILQTYRERQTFVKPSERRRKAKQAGRKRWLKTQEKQKADRGF